MLIILKESNKIESIDDIDKLINSEIPNREMYPRLYHNVINHMVHLPCNLKFSKCPKKKRWKMCKRIS
jgi:hypothetical protein